jgi:hypothetical protein
MVVSLGNQTGQVGSASHAVRDETLERGAVAERDLARHAAAGSCRSAAGLLVPVARGAQVSAHDRHKAAVARSLGWAEEAAARGDYAEALSWVQVVQAIGDQIPIEYQTKRRAWLSALAGHRARNKVL